jgi:hypothetical protein
MGAKAVIPPKRNRKVKREYDRELYKQGQRIECCFSKIEHFRRFAPRYGKLKKPRSTPASPSHAPEESFSYMSIQPSLVYGAPSALRASTVLSAVRAFATPSMQTRVTAKGTKSL